MISTDPFLCIDGTCSAIGMFNKFYSLFEEEDDEDVM
jgi:hypothetical protein